MKLLTLIISNVLNHKEILVLKVDLENFVQNDTQYTSNLIKILNIAWN